MFAKFILFFICPLFLEVLGQSSGRGLLLLYRPRDISQDCAFSEELSFDISYGMGMSDTLTLLFRTMHQVDYQCGVDIVTEPANTSIILVIKFPTSLGRNCASNPDAFTVRKKDRCIRVCNSLGDRDLSNSYFVAAVQGRVRFTFLSNSSVNADLKARLYQVTATSARPKPKRGCAMWNESLCTVGDRDFCFTSGVVCDGINNCGVNNWFDERKSKCNLAVERLTFAPVVAVGAAVLCALLAAGHTLMRCLPPVANSFFIFNANEDNRLCIDPLFEAPPNRPTSIERVRKISLIPRLFMLIAIIILFCVNTNTAAWRAVMYLVSSSSSDNNENDTTVHPDTTHGREAQAPAEDAVKIHQKTGRRKTFVALKSMTGKFHKPFCIKKTATIEF